MERLIALTHRDAARGEIARYTWEYDNAGRVTNHTSPDGAADFVYDANGQLLTTDYDAIAEATAGLADDTYKYDAAGNRTSATNARDTDTTVLTDAFNRLKDDGTYTYTYDNEGNRTLRTTIATGETVEYSYDQRNRLTGLAFKDGVGAMLSQTRYTYDPNDLRIATEVDANGDGTYEDVEHFILDGGSVSVVLDDNDAITHRYLHGPSADQVLSEEITNAGGGGTNGGRKGVGSH